MELSVNSNSNSNYDFSSAFIIIGRIVMYAVVDESMKYLSAQGDNIDTPSALTIIG